MVKKSRRQRRRAERKQRVRIAVRALEIARGHDGLLRGLPEAVIVFAGFWVSGGVKLLHRKVLRFPPLDRLPGASAPIESGYVEAAHGEGRLVGLFVAMEEDGGGDLERVYAVMGDVDELRFWERDAPVPNPVRLDQLGSGSAAPFAAAVHILDRGRDLGDRCTDDELIGTWVCVVPSGSGAQEGLRARFTSGDARNDWTLVLDVNMGR